MLKKPSGQTDIYPGKGEWVTGYPRMKRSRIDVRGKTEIKPPKGVEHPLPFHMRVTLPHAPCWVFLTDVCPKHPLCDASSWLKVGDESVYKKSVRHEVAEQWVHLDAARVYISHTGITKTPVLIFGRWTKSKTFATRSETKAAFWS